MATRFVSFNSAIDYSTQLLRNAGEAVDTGRWQGIPTEGKPDLVTQEILNLDFEVPLERASWHDPDGAQIEWPDELAQEIKPSLPWANEHFAERVGGVPLNPDPSHVRWPWWRGQYEATRSSVPTSGPLFASHKIPFKFTHTYSERFWPRQAGEITALGEQHVGIRYRYGDYNDVLDLLAEDPYTRQAYLPIFFPEDTGAVHRGRIPCSLGYHFLLRGSKLHCWYEIRSCDAVRHFRDDLYLAARLVGHTIDELATRERENEVNPVWFDVDPGTLYFKAHSFHVHMGDYHLLSPPRGEL